MIDRILSIEPFWGKSQEMITELRLWLLKAIPEGMRNDELLARVKEEYLDENATWTKESEPNPDEIAHHLNQMQI